MTHGYSVSENVPCPDKAGVKVGDIYYASWGYDQTNIEYAQVVEISPTGKTVMCRMMNQTEVPGSQGFMSETVMPSTQTGEVFRLRVKTLEDEALYLKGSYPFCNGKRYERFWKWDGKPKYQSHYA
jgi:hypothetical protein